MTQDTEKPFDMWAVVELFGHQRMAGRVTTVSVGAASFFRVDVPEVPAEPGSPGRSPAPAAPAFTRFLNPSAVYALNPTTEELARSAARHLRPQPVHAWEMPKQLAANGEDEPLSYGNEEGDGR